MKKVEGMAKGLGGAIMGVVGGIKNAIELFKDIISGKISIKQLVKDFVQAVENLPKIVSILKHCIICSLVCKKPCDWLGQHGLFCVN